MAYDVSQFWILLFLAFVLAVVVGWLVWDGPGKIRGGGVLGTSPPTTSLFFRAVPGWIDREGRRFGRERAGFDAHARTLVGLETSTLEAAAPAPETVSVPDADKKGLFFRPAPGWIDLAGRGRERAPLGSRELALAAATAATMRLGEASSASEVDPRSASAVAPQAVPVQPATASLDPESGSTPPVQTTPGAAPISDGRVSTADSERSAASDARGAGIGAGGQPQAAPSQAPTPTVAPAATPAGSLDANGPVASGGAPSAGAATDGQAGPGASPVAVSTPVSPARPAATARSAASGGSSATAAPSAQGSSVEGAAASAGPVLSSSSGADPKPAAGLQPASASAESSGADRKGGPITATAASGVSQIATGTGEAPIAAKGEPAAGRLLSEPASAGRSTSRSSGGAAKEAGGAAPVPDLFSGAGDAPAASRESNRSDTGPSPASTEQAAGGIGAASSGAALARDPSTASLAVSQNAGKVGGSDAGAGQSPAAFLAGDAHPGERPSALDASGGSDDLKLIKGIGPKNERACNGLGVHRFSQIADWSPANAEWVGHHMAFPGRIEREHWVAQAKLLAAGIDTAHSAAVKSGTIRIDDGADTPLTEAEATSVQADLPQFAPTVDGEAAHHGARPFGLATAHGGTADDLKRIKGIGPQNETRLHGLGIWHFDQIAAWSPDNVKWVGSYLAFPGRIARENWIAQATALAAGRALPLSTRAATGEVKSSL